MQISAQDRQTLTSASSRISPQGTSSIKTTGRTFSNAFVLR